MISLSPADTLVILLFFASVMAAGFIAPYFSKKSSDKPNEDYLLSGRNVGLVLFILTNVSTWYGGILGVGELTYSYGLLSWFTQGLPYYIFALVFAFFFAGKIRKASLFTIPDKLEETYGKGAAILSAISLFMLVSPAPYLLMTANLISMVFGVDIIVSLFISALISMIYLFRGGYKSDLYTDTVEFFVMFIGFIVMFLWAYFTLGGLDYLKTSLPPGHLTPAGGASFGYIVVWFLIALWTFADPGFHQRCYAAKSSEVAKKGILISILFWMLFDFLTTATGLYARAALPGLERPVMSYPALAEKLLPSGIKGIFYAGMFATILSTLNSFMFLSATTFSRDLVFRVNRNGEKVKSNTREGLAVAAAVSIAMAYYIPSVIELWYTIGTIFIPGIILPVISAYYPKLRISRGMILTEIIVSALSSLLWYLARVWDFHYQILSDIEPMLAGIFTALLIHISGFISVPVFRKK